MTRCCRVDAHACLMGRHLQRSPRFQWAHRLRCGLCRGVAR